MISRVERTASTMAFSTVVSKVFLYENTAVLPEEPCFSCRWNTSCICPSLYTKGPSPNESFICRVSLVHRTASTKAGSSKDCKHFHSQNTLFYPKNSALVAGGTQAAFLPLCTLWALSRMNLYMQGFSHLANCLNRGRL